jgi:hypothetical protein
VSKLAKGEVLMLNIGSMCTGARVLAVKHDLSKLQLTSPVCTKEGEKVALSRCVYWMGDFPKDGCLVDVRAACSIRQIYGHIQRMYQFWPT